jgi:hypothetical protein
VDGHVPPHKSTKEMQDKSEQERSHQEPGSVGKRISNDGGVDSALHPFGRPGHGGRCVELLQSRERVRCKATGIWVLSSRSRLLSQQRLLGGRFPLNVPQSPQGCVPKSPQRVRARLARLLPRFAGRG